MTCMSFHWTIENSVSRGVGMGPFRGQKRFKLLTCFAHWFFYFTCMCVGMHMPWCTCRGQRTLLRDGSCLPTTWIPSSISGHQNSRQVPWLLTKPSHQLKIGASLYKGGRVGGHRWTLAGDNAGRSGAIFCKLRQTDRWWTEGSV